MALFARTDTSALGQWWWTVDRWTLGALSLLIILGVMLSMTSSTIVAAHINLPPFYFAQRHLIFLIPSIAIILAVSILQPRSIRRVALAVFLLGIILLVLTPILGVEIKGAKRWLSLAGLSIQPSEFVKPAFAVMAAWMFSASRTDHIPGNTISIILYGIVVGLLLLQPDLGMVVVVTAVWSIQFFLAGLPMFWVLLAGVGGILIVFGAYFLFPHVAKRIDHFLDPNVGDKFGDRFQINQSLDAFMNGGFLGRGPGEGIVKKHIPDAHADFIFAVAGEEFGLILCILIVALFAFLVLRCLLLSLYQNNLFIQLAVAGLASQFGLQSVINMASTLHLIPTKGMTLPFLSYGGSSMLALALTMGMILGLSRKRIGPVLDV